MTTYTATIDDGQGGETTIAAETIQDALSQAREWADTGNWRDALENGTIWVSVRVSAPDTYTLYIGSDATGPEATLHATEYASLDAMTSAVRALWPDADLDILEQRYDVESLDYWPRYSVTEGESLCDDNYAIDPPEPNCGDHGEDHVWATPHSIVGGCKESPGVASHGGGITQESVCLRCGCAKLDDSWAQNRNNGRQGLDSVSYTEGKYSDEVQALMESHVEFTLAPALSETRYLIIGRLDWHDIKVSATYEIEADTDAYSSNGSDTDEWPGPAGTWPDPPQSMIDEAREIIAGSPIPDADLLAGWKDGSITMPGGSR